jgi:hypothetical protein
MHRFCPNEVLEHKGDLRGPAFRLIDIRLENAHRGNLGRIWRSIGSHGQERFLLHFVCHQD